MAIAIITRGTQSGRRLTIVQWPATIGRDASSVIPIDDHRVSRYHARIKKRDQLYILEDLQSKNGTWLNGDKVSNSVINSGDKILIGDTEIVFLTPEAQIDLASEMAELEHYATSAEADEIGGSIDLAGNQEPGASPHGHRIGSDLDLGFQNLPAHLLSTIFEIHSNILSADNIKDCAANTLKGMHAINSDIARSVMFLWAGGSRKLIPLATRHSGKSSKFHFNKRTLEGVVSRKQGLVLSPGITNTTDAARHRVVLPMSHQGELLCIIHFEIDNVAAGVSQELVDAARFLLERAAPSLDSFILRQDLENYSVGMIEAMIATLEAKDTYTHGHSERVSRYSLAIAEEMNLDRDVKKLLLMSSLCHDIGKIGIPDAILRKAALLNPDEYEEMKQHPVIGANIVAHLPNVKRFISGIKYHHEKWDGSGYPDGLAGEDIPFFGRIVAVADVFDAMVSGRSYSGFLDESEAVERLTGETDLFDPDVVRAFGEAWQSGRLTQKTSTQKNSPKKSDEST